MRTIAQGLSFPFRIGTRGRWVSSSADFYDDQHIKESIYQILLTNRGERRMEPEFGSDLRKLIFESNIPSLDTIIINMTAETLARWEPRIEVKNLEIIREYGTIVIRIDYLILETQKIATHFVNMGGGQG